MCAMRETMLNNCVNNKNILSRKLFASLKSHPVQIHKIENIFEIINTVVYKT